RRRRSAGRCSPPPWPLPRGPPAARRAPARASRRRRSSTRPPTRAAPSSAAPPRRPPPRARRRGGPARASRRRGSSAPPRRRPSRAWTARTRAGSLPDAVNRTTRGLPRVVRRARPVRRRVGHDARVAADLEGAPRVPEQVRVVALLPDEDQVRRGHELGDEVATGGGTRERVGAHAEPALVVLAALVGPQALFLGEPVVLEDERPALDAWLLHAGEFSGGCSAAVGVSAGGSHARPRLSRGFACGDRAFTKRARASGRRSRLWLSLPTARWRLARRKLAPRGSGPVWAATAWRVAAARA